MNDAEILMERKSNWYSVHVNDYNGFSGLLTKKDSCYRVGKDIVFLLLPLCRFSVTPPHQLSKRERAVFLTDILIPIRLRLNTVPPNRVWFTLALAVQRYDPVVHRSGGKELLRTPAILTGHYALSYI